MSLQSGGYPARVVTAPALEVAHILYMDVVAFSQLPSMEAQTGITSEIQDIVRATKEFTNASEKGALICRPSGDGMALIFFGDMLAPARCAVEIAISLKSRRHIRLRMGLHSGPVYVLKDINANNDVAGEGIVTAQRVMDCGDAGHILVSSQLAEVLVKAVPWSNFLKDLGTCPIKHGQQIHLFNLYSKEFGNARTPHRIREAKREVWTNGAGFSKTKTLLKAVSAISLIAAAAWAARPNMSRWLLLIHPAPAAPAIHSTSPPKQPHHRHHRLEVHPAGNGDVRYPRMAPPMQDPATAYPPATALPPRLLPGEAHPGTDDNDTMQPPSEGTRVFDKIVGIANDGLGLRDVKIEYQQSGSNSAETLVDDKYNEGDQIPIHFEYRGSQFALRVFYNQNLAKEWKLTIPLPPSPNPAQ